MINSKLFYDELKLITMADNFFTCVNMKVIDSFMVWTKQVVVELYMCLLYRKIDLWSCAFH